MSGIYKNRPKSNMVMDTGPYPQGKNTYQRIKLSFGKDKRKSTMYYIYVGK